MSQLRSGRFTGAMAAASSAGARVAHCWLCGAQSFHGDRHEEAAECAASRRGFGQANYVEYVRFRCCGKKCSIECLDAISELKAMCGGEQAQQAVHAWASAAVSTADLATLLRFPLASNHSCFDFYTAAKLYKLVNHSVYAKLLNHLQLQPPVGWAAFAGVLAGKARGSIPRGGTRGRPRQRVTQSRPSGSRRWRSGRSRRR